MKNNELERINSQEKLAKTFEESVLDIEQNIEDATSSLFKLDSTLESICEEIRRSLGFDFATIQLIRPEEQIIETVCGSELAGLARHYLYPDENLKHLRDIQADICQTCRTEIIAGWDLKGRFDRWIYQELNHRDYARIFIPIILLQDNSGQNNRKWVNNFQIKIIQNEQNQDWFRNHENHQFDSNGQAATLEIQVPNDYQEYEVKVIGTVEAGYHKPSEPISIEKAKQVIKLVGEKAIEIRKHQLPCVLDKIVENAMKMLQADAASLHFMVGSEENDYFYEINAEGYIVKRKIPENPDRIPYVYEVFKEEMGRDFIRECPPTKIGEGQKAIEKNQEKLILDASEVEQYNFKAFKLGIKAIAISPLILDFPLVNIPQTGALYVHFKREKPFDEKRIRWLKLFDNRVEEAIRQAIAYKHSRDSANQLMTLHSVAQSLSNIADDDDQDLLYRIAASSLNILAADTVTIYEYIEVENRFLAPVSVGRLISSQESQVTVDPDDVPYKLIKHGKSVYSSDEAFQEVFKASTFAQREHIKAVAGILLKANGQVIGTMFINYRRNHRFDEDEKKMIDTLACSAAIAIKNQQWLVALNEIDHKIKAAVDIQELLSLILDQARQLTGANLADIRLPDPSRLEELVMRVWYPANAPKVSLIRTKIGEGITGWVAKNKQSLLVPDVTKDSHYIKYFEDSGSELCVPLLDDNNYLLGVINLESYRKGAFTKQHQKMLEVLADRAVIAIKNVTSKEEMATMKAFAFLGKLTGPLIHRMNNNIGAIKVRATDIVEQGDSYSHDKAQNILEIAEQMLHNTKQIRSAIRQEERLPIDLLETIYNALDQAIIPSTITKVIALPTELPKVVGGEQQLIDVFDNLISNAVTAMPQGGTLTIKGEIQQEGGVNSSIAIDICDTGMGIPKENTEVIFEPGYTTQTSGQGIGFGLWWTRTYVQSLGGQIMINSQVNEGSEFIVILPVYQGEN